MDFTQNNTEFRGTCGRYRASCQPFSPVLIGSLAVNLPLGVVLTLGAIIGNSLVFAAYYYSESLRRPVHLLLLSLAATDLMSGLVTQPLWLVEKSLLISGSCKKVLCMLEDAEKLVMLSLIGATVLNLSMLTLDRYIAVCHTFKYPNLVTNSRVIKTVILVWLFWLVFLFSWMKAFSRTAVALFMIILTVNILFISFLYLNINREIRRVESNEEGRNASNQEERATRNKSVRTLSYIFGLLIFCFVPMIIHGIFSRSHIIRGFHEREHFLLLASNTAFSNSCLNVFVYYWRNKEMREAMRKAIRKLRQKFQNEVSP